VFYDLLAFVNSLCAFVWDLLRYVFYWETLFEHVKNSVHFSVQMCRRKWSLVFLQCFFFIVYNLGS
jgi:hypothetical protein